MGSWQETQELNAGAPYEYFGQAVDLSGDRIMASVPTQNATGTQIGGVYLFQSDGTSWTEYPVLLDPDNPSLGNYSRFGTAISLVGERALIGAPEGSSSLEQAGMAFLFVKAGDYWGGYYVLQASDAKPFARFGFSVSLSGDRALIGAHRDTVSGVDKGSAYIFDFDGTNWVQTAKLTATDGASSDEFGTSVSLDGDRAVVGAPRRNEVGSRSGAAYVFEFDGVGWTQSAKLAAGDGMANAYYGHQVKVAGDRIVVGAFGDQNFNGAAYIYDRLVLSH
jgi:hypothetical protein